MTELFLTPFELPFMQRALVELALLGVLGAVAGVHVVLRRLAFVSDTMTHTVFPGIVIAFLLEESVLIGALVFGVLSAVLLTLLTRVRRVQQDAALAILLTSFFSLGVVLVSRTETYTATLTQFLFGSVLAIDTEQIVQTAVLATIVLTVFALLHKELLLGAFDPQGALAMGYRTVLLDLVLNVLIALVVIAAVRAVGTVLVIALLVVPAVTAQLLTDRVAAMMAVACAVGVAGGFLGLIASYEASVNQGLRLGSGSVVVAALVAIFAVVALGQGARRLIARPSVVRRGAS